jgi:protein gp37
MSTKTGISWTDATWNPIRGCSRVSEGCRHCYAESIAYRFSGERLDGKPSPFAGMVQRAPDGMRLPQWNGKIKFVEEHLLDPLRWKKPRRIFVNSMSDLFHENVTDEMRDRIFAVMALCPQHTFQVLTKRPERMLEYSQRMSAAWVLRLSHAINTYSDLIRLADAPNRPMTCWPLPNVHLGVSVEDQKTADLRIPLLLQTPAAVRFISAEPLLGAVKLLWKWVSHGRPFGGGPMVNMAEPWKEPELLPGLDWVIVGGESGPGARPMHPDWARSLRDQCKAAGVPFFFKQHGEWISLCDYDPFVHGFKADKYPYEFAWQRGGKNEAELPISCYRVGTKAAGCLLDGVEHHEFPAVSA